MGMTTPTDDGIPVDTFAIRLAVVRAVMGWNYDQAARATGIGSETWRTWEKGKRRCTDVLGVGSVIAEVTGLSRDWIVLGGPLAAERVARVTHGHQRTSVTGRYSQVGRHTPHVSGRVHSERCSAERPTLINKWHHGVSACDRLAA